MGRRRAKGDAIDGILLLDKDGGMTSNGALQRAKRMLNAQKAGHTGSLDPIATGLLPLCFGEATKVSSFLLESDKAYVTDVQLGVTTETCDIEGEVVTRRSVSVTEAQINAALDAFRGDILQIPPMYSAIKRDGQPLYKLARQGIEVEREPRPVTVHALTLDAFDEQTSVVRLSMRVSSGFYVRTLAFDLGEALGCGGHVVTLRRTEVAGFTLDQSIGLGQLEATEELSERRKALLPSDVGLAHLPSVTLSVDATFYLCRGQAVRAAELPIADSIVRLYSSDTGFLGLGTVLDDGRVAPRRLFVHA